MKAVVIQVVQEPNKTKTNDYSVKVMAMGDCGGVFEYEFIKNKLCDTKEIVQGFTWEINSKIKTKKLVNY